MNTRAKRAIGKPGHEYVDLLLASGRWLTVDVTTTVANGGLGSIMDPDPTPHEVCSAVAVCGARQSARLLDPEGQAVVLIGGSVQAARHWVGVE